MAGKPDKNNCYLRGVKMETTDGLSTMPQTLDKNRRQLANMPMWLPRGSASQEGGAL